MDDFYTYDGVTAFDSSGNRYDVFDLIMAGINVAGATLSHSPYYAENDPRFKQGGRYSQPVPRQSDTRSNQDFNAGGSFDPRTGLRLNTQISPWMIAVGGGLLVALLAGSLLGGRKR